MLRAIRILASSSSLRSVSLYRRLNDHHAKFSSISRKQSESSEVHALASQFRCGFSASQMALAHSDSAPAPAETSSSSSSSSSSLLSTSTAFQSTGFSRKISFCQWCGGRKKHEIPDGDHMVRAICTDCGSITFQNPKIVRSSSTS